MEWKLGVTKGRRGGSEQTVNNLLNSKVAHLVQKTLQEGYLKQFLKITG